MSAFVVNLVCLLSVSNMSQGSVIGQYHPTWEEGDDSLNRFLAGLNMTYPVNGPSSVVRNSAHVKHTGCPHWNILHSCEVARQ